MSIDDVLMQLQLSFTTIMGDTLRRRFKTTFSGKAAEKIAVAYTEDIEKLLHTSEDETVSEFAMKPIGK
ncbi:MAG: hypothetical protein QXF26_03710 [Candidatus Bathyarchaeia archaeon]